MLLLLYFMTSRSRVSRKRNGWPGRWRRSRLGPPCLLLLPAPELLLLLGYCLVLPLHLYSHLPLLGKDCLYQVFVHWEQGAGGLTLPVYLLLPLLVMDPGGAPRGAAGLLPGLVAVLILIPLLLLLMFL
jgi:hypothetical protein